MESTIIFAASPVVEVSHTLIISRRVSECPSEDSYIVFEGCDSELDDLDSNFDNDDEDSDESDDDIYWERGKQQKTEGDEDNNGICCRNAADKKVHFPPDEHLAEVHRMIMWSFAYRECRKGHWEQYSRDRARFQRRIDCCREDISRILQAEHREKIYKERFLITPPPQEKSQRKTFSGSNHNLMDDKKKHSPKRHKRRRNGKKKKKNRHKRRR